MASQTNHDEEVDVLKKDNRKINILLVDDRPENLLALESVLVSPHYNLIRANSGEEALKSVLQQNFAVILLDVQMPGLNGFETAKLIKERERSKHIPIIFITAMSQSVEHVLHGYSAGAVDYIFKPFYPETLKLKVQEFVKIYHNQEQMTRLDRQHLIENMAAGIAHEIRNPLTTVRGFLELSKLRREQLSYEHIDLMLEELNRANSIITEFLSLARNKVNHMRLQSLNPIVEALFPLIQAEAFLSDKRVALEISECPEVYLDEKEIRQLILNLALNGLESMSAGGLLAIKTYAEDGAIILEIQDQGSGIKSEWLEKIGTPFFTTKDMGTGLGLAICYSVVDRHDALLEFNTSEQGTVFMIRFNPDKKHK